MQTGVLLQQAALIVFETVPPNNFDGRGRHISTDTPDGPVPRGHFEDKKILYVSPTI